MRQPVATLVLLACAAAPATAASITDQDLVISLGGALQLRAEHSDATQEGDAYNPFTGALAGSGADSDYDVNTGAAGKADPADFYARRIRLIFKATYQEVWRLNITLSGDRADQPRGTATTTSTGPATRGVAVYEAFLARDFRDGTVVHTIQAGLDFPFFNRAGDFGPNTQSLLPNQRASAQLLNARGMGVAYRLTSPLVRAGLDVQNNVGDDGTANLHENDGLLYTGRVELTGPGELAITRWQESFAGNAGHGWCLGLEAGYNHHDQIASLSEAAYAHDFNGNAAANTLNVTTAATPTTIDAITQSTLAYGADLLVHWDDLSALAEVRLARTDAEVQDSALGTLTGSYDSLVWLVQAGYALHLADGTVLEPALRFTAIDLNTRNDSETAPFGSNDFGVSGRQYEAGLTWYLNGHANKLALAATWWQAEQGDADATIVRLQHQFTF
jgi:hypothetical protein